MQGYMRVTRITDNQIETSITKMSRPRTRSQGPPETEIIDDGEEAQHIVTQRRLSRELQIWLETLRFYPARGSEGKEPSVASQQQTARAVRRPASVIL